MTSIKEKKKAKRIAVLSILAILVIAALCFVFGYAIAEGWETVGAWFTSKYAVLTIIAIAVVIIGGILFYFFNKDKEDFK